VPAARSKFAFLTLPRYSMIALSNAVEPLRMANSLTGQSVYEWSIVSLDGQPTAASNGLKLSPTSPLEQAGAVDILFVCGGVDVQEAVSPKIIAALKRLAERRTPLGALCTGGYALAKAGLLDRYRATIHWENLSALREEFPRIQLSDQLFTIDRDRFTCSGGVAPLDLMLHLVEAKLGASVSQLISEQFIVDRVRNDRDRQYVPLRAQIGVSHESLIKVAQLMEENIEKPLSLDEIAAATGLSRRQIERLSTVCPSATTCRCACAARASFCCRPPCRSSTSRRRAAFSRRRTSRAATGRNSAARRVRNGRRARARPPPPNVRKLRSPRSDA
jgi:transcriptional regulator GlxA family with amidase domain